MNNLDKDSSLNCSTKILRSNTDVIKLNLLHFSISTLLKT